MNLSKAIQNPGLTWKKAVGRLRRNLAKLPAENDAAREELAGGIVFEHKRLSFLEPDDIRAMMTQSYDITLCICLRRYLRPGDIMLDVGANIGYISAVAAGCVGKSGVVHGFEPLRECFDRLEVLKAINPKFNFAFHNVALGAEQGTLNIAFDPQGDMRNATLVPGRESPQSRAVPVWRLDEYIASHISSPEKIRFIKIDVEGFEFAVLRGLEKYLETGIAKPLIVCEIKPWEIVKLGYSMGDFAAYLKRYGYGAFEMDNDTIAVDVATMTEMDTLLFRPI